VGATKVYDMLTIDRRGGGQPRRLDHRHQRALTVQDLIDAINAQVLTHRAAGGQRPATTSSSRQLGRLGLPRYDDSNGLLQILGPIR
jgi:hypothetical protein